jgi:hypothetical protein
MPFTAYFGEADISLKEHIQRHFLNILDRLNDISAKIIRCDRLLVAHAFG